MGIEIRHVATDLYMRYRRQSSPQPTHIYLERDGRVTADVDGEIGGAVSHDVWHGITRRYKLPSPYMTAEAINAAIDALAPLLARVHDGHSVAWDGSNKVGKLTDDALDAEGEIERYLDGIDPSEGELVTVWDASEWFDPIRSELVNRMVAGETDEQIEAWLEQDSAGEVDYLEGVASFVARLRCEASEANEAE